ncbi:MAG: protein-(glutamine-N5) methyltransferase, release factor-specific [Planctomycetes bacterium RBG_16_64_12]|nr:MAG: protein-(glutamine-N5) methyltransferase, release factor-specific [Planctomycetes bacterium RBG_16_64_12]
MSETEAWTVGRLLVWTTDYLKRHGSDSPRLDAEVLLAESLGCRRIELYTAFDSVPGERVRTAFRDLVRRRAEGRPVAYLVGRREFYSLSFRVTPDVLIPRPETELLVVALLELARAPAGRAPTITICDVGTGSGVIAVAAAKHLPGARVTALDVSPAALAVARTNAAEHGVQEQVELIESDLFSAVPPQRRFDFVVSNPPYVSEAEIASLPRDVREFEPRQALVAGPCGTEVIESLVPQAAERLNPGGHLLLEINPALHDAVQALLEADGRFEPGPTVKDLARLPRVVQAKRK